MESGPINLIIPALLALAAIGLAVSAYFTVGYYGSGAEMLRGVPAALCRAEERSCTTVIHTPYARLLGVPNAVLGLLYYIAVAVWAILALNGAAPAWLTDALLLAAVAVVALAPYLVWALVRQLKTWCPL